MSNDLPHLFSPLALGPVVVANRIVSTAHQTGLVHDFVPTEDFVAYHEARARGGAGLIVLEATAVHPTGLLTAHTVAGYRDEVEPAWARVATAVRGHGARLFAQLFHGGREQIADAPRQPAVAPSAIPSPRFHVEPRALRDDEVDAIVAGYARAAVHAAAAGLDGVEISAAHNYLVAQFFTPAFNRRLDRWAEPTRFVLAVLEAVRAAAPGLAVGIRFSAGAPAAPIAAGAVASLVDYVSVALGDSSSPRGSSFIVPPPPVARNVIAARTAPFRVGVPVIATSRIVDPVEADRLIADGATDAAGMTRALITDPDLPHKAAHGRHQEILRCIGCNVCIAHYHAGTPIACGQNPRTGRERSLPPVRRGGGARRVVVVGGGPAGLAAAAEAGAGGHEVTLFEGAPRLGGQVALVAGTAAHAELAASLLANYAELLDGGGVDVRLGTSAGAGEVASLEPEGVVVATGARAYEPGPDLDLEGVEVLQGWEVLNGRRPSGGRVLVADWGGDPTGFDCADLLRLAGLDVTLVSAGVVPGAMVHQYARNLYLERLYRAGVVIEQHLELAGASAKEVRFRNLFARELERTLAADALVLCLGRVPEDQLAGDLRRVLVGVAVEEAGDCIGPRSLEEAVLEGTLAAQRITG